MSHGAFFGSAFLSALVLFSAEPLVAKALLPRSGGGPWVWTTCLLFFQCAVLAGYAVTYVISRFGLRLVYAHIALIAFATASWAGSRLSSADEPGASLGILGLIGTLVATAGPLVVVLAANSTLTQMVHASKFEEDPSYLYAASNSGSLLALVSYPLLVEPFIGLSRQSEVLTAALVVLLGVVALCHWFPQKRTQAYQFTVQPAASISEPRGWVRWLLLSMAPSLILFAATNRLTLDVGSTPLLWMPPLAVYMLTFVISFSLRDRLPLHILDNAALTCIAVGMVAVPFLQGFWLALVCILATQFLTSLACHAHLAASRPHASELPRFFLLVSLGGVLGGILGGVAPPFLFKTVAEFPLSLAVTSLALVTVSHAGSWTVRRSIAVSAILALAMIAAALLPERAVLSLRIATLVSFVIALLLPSRLVFASVCGCAATLIAARLGDANVLERSRNIYGTIEIDQATEGSRVSRRMFSAATIHGTEVIAPATGKPASYYHPATPLGSVVASLPDNASIAIIGMGTGALGALTKPSQRLVWFEIDPSVERIARQWFTYLNATPATSQVLIGDARLSLRSVPFEDSFDLIVVDAFSGDAVPTHLMTVEALSLYLQKLKPSGIVLLHVSNKHLDLERVAKSVALAAGREPLIYVRPLAEEALREGAMRSQVVAVPNTQLGRIRLGTDWVESSAQTPAVWTDDFTSILSVLRTP